MAIASPCSIHEFIHFFNERRYKQDLENTDESIIGSLKDKATIDEIIDKNVKKIYIMTSTLLASKDNSNYKGGTYIHTSALRAFIRSSIELKCIKDPEERYSEYYGIESYKDFINDILVILLEELREIDYEYEFNDTFDTEVYKWFVIYYNKLYPSTPDIRYIYDGCVKGSPLLDEIISSFNSCAHLMTTFVNVIHLS